MSKKRQKKERMEEQVRSLETTEPMLKATGQMHQTHVHNLDECEDHESCRQLLSTLGEYVDGALSEELCNTLERHMNDCQRCRVVVNTMKKTVELYQVTGEETHIPADVRERLFLRLNLDDFLK